MALKRARRKELVDRGSVRSWGGRRVQQGPIPWKKKKTAMGQKVRCTKKGEVQREAGAVGEKNTKAATFYPTKGKKS